MQAFELRNAERAFLRYEEVRHRLPQPTFSGASDQVDSLADVAHRYDAFVLDAYGVLNVGTTPIPGAVARIADLRRLGKRVIVLTNAASYPRKTALEKYHKLGFDFGENEVVSSRDVACLHLDKRMVWGAAAAADDGFGDIAARVVDVMENPAAMADMDGFLLLSSARWDANFQMRLKAALAAHPRPVVVANPDLVAPTEAGLSIEPGAFAHDLADALGQEPVFYGKPFPDAYAAAKALLPGIPAHRIAMVGDTLHTDVLGGRAAGMGTVLITQHGLFAGHDVAGFIARSGIVPDVVARTT
jgi:glycerol-1-phosphatase